MNNVMNTEYVSMAFDAKQMIRILGNDLYDSPLAMLRENVQNAYDAILERKRIDTAFSPRIDIIITKDRITIQDNGIGMNRDILANNYWKAGNSSKNTPEAMAAGVVGHFGIGALANFGVCTKLELKTRKYGESVVYYSEAERDKLNIEKSIPIVPNENENFDIGTRVEATLESPGTITKQNAVEYLRPYIEYIEVPIFLNDEKFPAKRINFDAKIQGKGIQDGHILYKMDIFYGNSFPLNVIIKAYDIVYMGAKLKGYVYLDTKDSSIMGLRNGFGLAGINVNSVYNFGGAVNLDNLTPTAGREAVSRESTSLVGSIIRSIERSWTDVISNDQICDMYRDFIIYVSNNFSLERAKNIKIKVANEERSIPLSEIKPGNVNSYKYADSVDSSVLDKFRNSSECVLSVSDNSNRKKIQRCYLKQMGVESIPNDIQIIKEYSDKEISIDQYFVLSELKTIIEEDYYVKDFCIKFADISHMLSVYVSREAASNQFCIYLSPNNSEIKHLTTIRNENYRMFTPIAKDIVRTVLYQQFSRFIPTNIKERSDYIARVIQRRKDEYIIPYEMTGSMDELLEQFRENKISTDEFIRIVKEERNKHQQTINQSQVGDVAEVVSSITDRVIAQSDTIKKSVEQLEAFALPPILCLNVETKLRILKTDEITPVLHNNRMFMALTDRMVNSKRIFFTNPHTTRVIWSMHRLIYIFTDQFNKYTLYYDLELTKKIPNTTGGKSIPSTTIISKDKIFVPIVEELYDYFQLNMDDKLKFYVHFDEIENVE